MNPGLQNLISLQDIELKIAVLRKRIADIPRKITELTATRQSLQAAYENKAAHLKELANNRRALEGEVELSRSKLSRLKDQLMAVKTNKEYTAMLSEIKMAEDHIREQEDLILEVMEQQEAGETTIKLAEAEMHRECALIQEDIRVNNESIPVLESELQTLMGEKNTVEARVDRDLLEQYQRIASVRKGVALAEAKDELCSVCHVRIRPQLYADLIRTETILFCDSCSRILFFRGGEHEANTEFPEKVSENYPGMPAT